MRHAHWLAPALAAALFAAPATAQDGGTALESGAAVESPLPFEGVTFRTFIVEVPEGATRLQVTVEATGDADVYLKAGGPIINDWVREATASSRDPGGEEEVVLTADGDPALRACLYYVDVVHGGGPRGEPMTFRITAEVESDGSGGGALPLLEDDGGLDPDLTARFGGDYSVDLDMPAATPNYRTLRMDVPEGVAAVVLTADGGGADVDLYVRFGAKMRSWEQADQRANGPGTVERLEVRAPAGHLRAGAWFIDVARAGPEDARIHLEARFVRGGADEGGADPGAGTGELLPTDRDDVLGEVRGDTSFPLVMGDAEPSWRSYLIHVPPGTASLLIEVTGASEDVDLYLRHGEPIADWRADSDHVANGSRADERLYLDRETDPPLRPGVYFLDIKRAFDGRDVGDMEVSVHYDAERPPPLPATEGPITALVLGERTRVDLAESGRKAARFSVEVPEGARRLHVAVLGATRDIELFLRRGLPITDYGDASGFDHRAYSARLNERLVVDATTTPPLRPGTYYLDVASVIGEDERIAFSVVATVDIPPALRPEDLRLPPFHDPADLTRVERALQAVVQVASENGQGSGTCLTPSGYVLTNHHVLSDGDDLQEEDIFISFVDRFDEPPLQVFVAEVVGADEELDLALLRLTRDIHDRPLEVDLDLPWLPLGEARSLRHGEPLLIAGYPSVGGFEFRTTLTLTRGVVSGFLNDRERVRRWIKTDGAIASGNSGGAALDQHLRLVGVPTIVKHEEHDKLGYCRSIDVLPDGWRERIEAELR